MSDLIQKSTSISASQAAPTTTPRSSAGPLIHRLIAEGTLPNGYATDNGAGLIYHGTELSDAFADPDAFAYQLEKQGDGSVRETRLPTRLLQ